MVKTPIVQFGTSRFLQAHVDLFVSEALESGAAIGPITIVQTSGDASRARRLAALSDGFDIQVRGLRDGARLDETRRVTSVARAMSLAADFDAVRDLIVEEAEIILSNTADAGFKPQAADIATGFDHAMSYPAKLTHLLHARYKANARPIQIMPTELVQDNGTVLRGLVLGIASKMEPEFREWLSTQVRWVNSLVDRIVSEPLEPAGAVAEPYALWAIEDCPGLVMPCQHADVQRVKDLGVIERRKLFILNLGHTWMVSRWLANDRKGAVFVRDVMEDADFSALLRAVYSDEVLPAFKAAGEGDGVEDYIAATLERFANPFLNHRLQDIAQNHAEKLERRITAFLDWARAKGDVSAKPELEKVTGRVGV